MRARRRTIGMVLGLVLSVVSSPAVGSTAHADSGFATESITLAGNDPIGEWTQQPLRSGTLYRLTASGTYDYGLRQAQLADAECTHDATQVDPVRDAPSRTSNWLRHRWTFFAAPDPLDPYNVLNTDLRDPDPTDDPGDVYVDQRNVEWAPIGESVRHTTGPLGCHDGHPAVDAHRYEVFFLAPQTRPVNLRVYDVFYEDNDPPGPDGENTIEITVEEVADTGLSLGRHIETVLVSPETEGATSTPLPSGDDFVLVAHGMWTYQGPYHLADAECTRTPGDPAYHPHRFGAGASDTGEMWIDGAPVEWQPVVPAQVWARTVPFGKPATVAVQGCDGMSHYYTVGHTGTGAPLHFEMSVPPDSAGVVTGHLSVDIYELDTPE